MLTFLEEFMTDFTLADADIPFEGLDSALKKLRETGDLDRFWQALRKAEQDAGCPGASGFYGVEGFSLDGPNGPIVEYLNSGDTYSGTIAVVRDSRHYGDFRVLWTTWGDIVEKWDRDRAENE